MYRKDRGVIPLEEVYPPSQKVSHLHYVIDDTLTKPLESFVDGKIYDSKSALRAAAKATGAYEVGNDWVNKKREYRSPEGIFPEEKIYKTLWDKLDGYKFEK